MGSRTAQVVDTSSAIIKAGFVGQPGGVPWHRGLYAFHEAPMTCVYGTFCMPCLYGENVNREEGSNCILNCVVYATLIMFCLQCLVHMQTRKRMRQKYGLEEEPCNDFHVTAWCYPCAICQEAEQIEYQARQESRSMAMSMQAGPPPPQYMQQGANSSSA